MCVPMCVGEYNVYYVIYNYDKITIDSCIWFNRII